MGDFKKFLPRYRHPNGKTYGCKCDHRPNAAICNWPKCPPRNEKESGK